MIIEGICWLARLAGLIVSGVRVMARVQLSLAGAVDVAAAAAGVTVVDGSVLMWRVDLYEPIGTGPCAFRPLGCSVKWKINEFSLMVIHQLHKSIEMLPPTQLLLTPFVAALPVWSPSESRAD